MIDIQTAELLKLDHAGFVPSPGMSREDFLHHTEKILETHRNFDEALENIREGSIAWPLVKEVIESRNL